MLPVSGDQRSAEGSEQTSGGLARDIDAPDGLIGAASASLLAAIAEARSALAAELVLCAAFGAVETGLPDCSVLGPANSRTAARESAGRLSARRCD